MKLTFQSIRKSIASVAVLAILCAGVLTFTACPKTQVDQNVAFARDVAALSKPAARLRLRKTLRSGARAARLASMMPISSSMRLPRVMPRTSRRWFAMCCRRSPTWRPSSRGNDVVLGLMAGGQIALNFFINHFLDTGSASKAGKARTAAAAAESGELGAVDRFRALPQFGCRLKPERCHLTQKAF
jgi:hypothetical protein